MPLSQFVETVLPTGSVTGGIATLSLAVAIGVAFGNVRIHNVRLGVAAVLFTALLFGQLGLTIEPTVLQYLRDFALVVFVYSIGLQLGPGFVASLRSDGLQLNVLAVAVVLGGAAMTAGIVRFGHLPHAVAAGLYTGSFATTPALAAGQDALRQVASAHGQSATSAVEATNLAYSVTYPFGLLGPILLVIVLRVLFRVDLKKEAAALADRDRARRPPFAFTDIEVLNAGMTGIPLRDQCFLQDRGVRFTRMLRGDEHKVPTADTIVQLGDIFRAIGPVPVVEELVQLMGRRSSVVLADVTGTIERAQVVVTSKAVLGKPLSQLGLISRFGVTIARVHRAGVDLPARGPLKLQFGDDLTAIGPAAGLRSVETELGNSADALNYTQLIPIFVGIWLGVIVGSIPLALPGISTPIRIGLAGGPMLVAILLSRLGHLGSVVWYMPASANQLLRDFGMAVFLACVGFESGDHFLQKLLNGGLPLVGWGIAITLVPMAAVAIFARVVMRLNFITLSGLISGAMTSSPTLLFANEAVGSNAPAVAYAAVYPLSMLIPVFCSQLLVTLLMR